MVVSACRQPLDQQEVTRFLNDHLNVPLASPAGEVTCHRRAWCWRVARFLRMIQAESRGNCGSRGRYTGNV
jgi:hypothetical protein